jgi:cob(I)alamin adenosyltransferase
MGKRLTRIYTRTGDDGSTGLADGQRLRKDALRVECIGTVDELNCAIGLTLALGVPEQVRAALAPVQHTLFDIGAELALPGQSITQPEQVSELEHRLDALNANLPPLKEFILPGGSSGAAQCHAARAICRRSERLLVALQSQETSSNASTLHYINRLSDLLFVAARVAARANGGEEILWKPRARAGA